MPPEEILKFLRLTYAGLSEGALLALIALGLVLVFKSTDVINFAHGEFMLLGAYIGFQSIQSVSTFVTEPTLLLAIGLTLMVLVTVGVGVLVERLILRPLIGEPVISVIMVTIGLSNIVQAIIGIIWGKNARTFPIQIIPIDGVTQIRAEGVRAPLSLHHDKLFVIFLVLVIVLALVTFFRRSKYGIAMRAAADDQQAAMSMGISIKMVFALTWALASLTAGIAGLLIAHQNNGVSSDIGIAVLRAFPVIILGGLDSIAGAVIGGFIIGLVEVYASGYSGNFLRDVAPYLLILIVLMVKPYGLFGQKRIERV